MHPVATTPWLGPALRLLAAGLAGWALWRLGPLARNDAFAGTLAVLPLVAVALFEVERAARRITGHGHGGRKPPALRSAAALGLGLWALVVVVRPHLALAGLDRPLMAAFALLLAGWVAALLLALRPLLGRRLPARPSGLFLLLPFVVYLALLPWSTRERPPDGDEPWYLLITHSLAHDWDADLTNNYAAEDWRAYLSRPLTPQPGDPTGPKGELYSRHNALLPLALAPAYRVGGLSGALLTMALLTAALAWMTLRLGRHYAPERAGEALLAYALVAFAPPLLLYSNQIWVEVPAALLSMIALNAVLEGRRALAGGAAATVGWSDRRRWLTLGACVLLLPLLKIRFMLLAAPLLVLGWWHAGRPWRPVLAIGLALAALGGAILLHNQWLYDNPLKIHTWQEVELGRYPAANYLYGASGLFFDAAFGLFACAPLWLLLIPAVGLLAWRRHPLPLDLLLFVLPYLAIVAPRAEWYGGWSPPFRYALVALPLLGLALAPLLAHRRTAGAKALLAALGAATLALTLLWVAVPGWTYNFADGRTYLLDHLSARWGADVARLFPSSVRPRAATWVWPAAALVLVPLLWWRPRRWPRRAACWGLAAALAATAALPLAARALPTRRIELEDPQVVKTGGHLHPDRWVIERTRYRGGWVLREGESLSAPVVAGGGRARLAVDAFFVRHHPGPLLLTVRAGEQSLATLRLSRPRQWQRHELGEIAWPAGAVLTIEALPAPEYARSGDARSGGAAAQPNGAVLDRVEIAWR